VNFSSYRKNGSELRQNYRESVKTSVFIPIAKFNFLCSKSQKPAKGYRFQSSCNSLWNAPFSSRSESSFHLFSGMNKRYLHGRLVPKRFISTARVSRELEVGCNNFFKVLSFRSG